MLINLYLCRYLFLSLMRKPLVVMVEDNPYIRAFLLIILW